ncbi:MAG: 50S ribosomal protein L10 [Candidatus Magasanikbacteria bacterium CG_4_9_14_3_um_filter_32_9]|uniref:Large ribosomal subunit protein uL10 n=1 Tax=Candidatus Magasanikbacteria bacterium CG_4_9_14_3_um_filter_32_9 TaxID=1974644 RepID=A0A2M7Z6J4_9BACT|nr:MAG: 50S ribosomal protein L10 [Candidatus Magasanikbacteria bacterium CG_4_9_14_3_um_filter_32_9]
MAKTRQQKESTLERLTDGIKNSKSIVFANFQGLTVSQTDDLRSKCKEEGVKCLISKKTLIKKAAANAGLEIDSEVFKGGVAVFFGTNDEVAPAQIVSKFAKNFEIVKVFGGVLEGKYIEAMQVNALAKLPGKQQLYAQLVGTINDPISGFVNVLAGNLRSVVNVLNAIKDSKSEA